MQTPILTVTLNPAYDLATSIDRVLPELKLRCAAPSADPGGGGINVSRAIARLGGDSRAAVSLGGATGERMAQLLAGEGVATVPLPAPGETVTLRVSPGPRDDWFTPEALETFTSRDWVVSEQSNRVGVRFEEPTDDPPFEAPPLERSRGGELASEGVVAGSLQVPHSGVPVLFLADHPVTGGYPVIGVVLPEDLPLAAQLPPGSTVRFTCTDPPHPASDTAGDTP